MVPSSGEIVNCKDFSSKNLCVNNIKADSDSHVLDSSSLQIKDHRSYIKMRSTRFLSLLSLVTAMVFLQVTPANAADYVNTYYSGYTASGQTKIGYKGMIRGGSIGSYGSNAVLGIGANLYIRTYDVFGNIYQSGTTASNGPVSIYHALKFDAQSRCFWTPIGASGGTREIVCNDFRTN